MLLVYIADESCYCFNLDFFTFSIKDFEDAEADFKKNLERSDSDDLQNLFYLGLSQYYRGKVRVCKYVVLFVSLAMVGWHIVITFSSVCQSQIKLTGHTNVPWDLCVNRIVSKSQCQGGIGLFVVQCVHFCEPFNWHSGPFMSFTWYSEPFMSFIWYSGPFMPFN